MSDDGVRLPNNSHRTAVIGRTGSGKTQAGLWHLSLKNFATFPWIIFDTKGDDMIREIGKMPATQKIRFIDPIPRRGLSIIRPLPHEMKSDQCEDFLWKIHKRGKCGLFIDEGYMFDKYSDALNALYTQGRSLQIPMITLSQKPKYLTQFTFSESDFFQVFDLNDRNDRKRINEFMPADLERPLQPFHSLWYDVGRRSITNFSPVPARDAILDEYAAQLRFAKRVI